MARSRTWNLRLNLDDFNAAFAALDDDSEKAHFLSGLSRGANGGDPKVGASSSFVSGFSIGSRMRQEAEGFRVSQTINGAKGGRPPKEPEVNPNETQSKPMGSQSETQSEPKVNPNHNPQSFNPLTTIPNPQSLTPSESCGELPLEVSPPPVPPGASSPPPPAKKAAPVDPTPVLRLVPCVGSGPKEWPLTEGKMAEWAEAFPGVNVHIQVRQAIQWLVDHPAKRKTFGGMPAFFSSWLAREQNRNQPLAGAPNGTRTPAHRAHADAGYVHAENLRTYCGAAATPSGDPGLLTRLGDV